MPKKQRAFPSHILEHKMNMALQKFAHGATHYCNFKNTALCENALHYDKKPPSTSKFYVDFKKMFFKHQKIETHLSIFKFFAPCQVDR